MIVTINGFRLCLEANDIVDINYHECGRCGTTHAELEVERNGKRITHFGEYLTLHGKDEIYGGVLVDEHDKTILEYHWVTYIISNDMKTGMTEDERYYIGLCGKVLNNEPENKHDRMTFTPSHIRGKERERICSKCSEIYNIQRSK